MGPGPAPSAEGEVWITPGSGEVVSSDLRFAGHTVWARRLPAPLTAVFALADATVSPDDVARLTALAATPAVVWRVQGSYSTEGSLDDNRVLGLARANAVRDVLVRAGVAPSKVIAVSVVDPSSEASPESQRSATATAELAPEDRP